MTMLATFATPNYVNKLQLLLASCKHFDPTTVVRVYCTGWSNELIEAARQQYPGYQFVHQPISSIIEDNIHRNKRSGALLSMKPGLLYRTYQELPPSVPVIWVDADTLVLHPIDPIISHVKLYGDFGCTYRPASRPFAKFAVAVMYFTHTPKGTELLEAYVQETETCQGINGWYQDQLSLLAAYTRIKPKLVPLTEAQHSLQGDCRATLVSRRPKFDTPQMYTMLRQLGVSIPEIK